MLTSFEEFIRVLKRFQCVSVRIDIKKDLPVTVVAREYRLGDESVVVNLADIINAEDLTVVLARIDEISVNCEQTLRVNCRFVPDNQRYLICCDMRRDEEESCDYLYGVIMDVHEFYKNKGNDPVEQELKKKELYKFSASGDIGIVEIIGKEQLCKMQIPLSINKALHSAILNEGGRFICSADLKVREFSLYEYKYTRQVYIKVNQVVYAIWVIASDDSALIDLYAPIQDMLVQTLSKLANSYVMLYNEMNNTENANKLLSETIEQQMLLNGIYSTVLKERNSDSTVYEVIRMVGETLNLDRVMICEDCTELQKYKVAYEWGCADTVISGIKEFNYHDYPKLIEELSYYETYFSQNPDHDVLGFAFTSYVASNLMGDGCKYGMIVYVINDHNRILTHAEKRLLRSTSQIVAAVITRCRDNKKLDESKKELHQLAYYDKTFGIKNKSSLELDISLTISGGLSGAVVAFKIPNIKNIHNFIGDNTDRLVKEVIKKIEGYNKTSAQVYRYSDELFMILLRDIDLSSANEFCREFVEWFDKGTWELDGANYTLEVSAGAAMYPQTSATVDELCRIAVMSMHNAADYRGNRYAIFAGEFVNSKIDGYHCAQLLREAVENNMRGLTVKFLPVYSKEGAIVSCEPMPVFTEPQELHRNYTTQIIMNIAEKMGFDVPINTWVIKKACEFCKYVREKTGEPFTVGVNATARSLTTGTILQMVKEALEQTGLTPDGLSVQFAEQVVAVHYDDFIVMLHELNRLKVAVTLDNVGSHYTATSMFRYEGITAAKVDVTIFTGIIDEFSKIYINNLMQLTRENNVNVAVKGLEDFSVVVNPDIDRYQGGVNSAVLEEEALLGLITDKSDKSVEFVK
jgi:EAL domain-containing protein (putative c-di-GMP-specific phosphodiesterase class I)/GGDEF domain-containing protein